MCVPLCPLQLPEIDGRGRHTSISDHYVQNLIRSCHRAPRHRTGEGRLPIAQARAVRYKVYGSTTRRGRAATYVGDGAARCEPMCDVAWLSLRARRFGESRCCFLILRLPAGYVQPSSTVTEFGMGQRWVAISSSPTFNHCVRGPERGMERRSEEGLRHSDRWYVL